MKHTEITPLDMLVQHSLKQHIDMVELLRPLKKQLETPTLERVTRFNEIYGEFQKKVKTIDKELIEHLEKSRFSESATVLLDQRQMLQREILDILSQTVSRANSVKSLMADEIKTVKNGRKALGGYKTQSDHNGSIVNRTS